MSNSDIIIIGAGLIGTSFVNALAKLNYRITLLETHLPDFANQKDYRPLTLALGSQRILQTLGIWDELEKKASPINTVRVSEEKRFGQLSFHHDEYGVKALGFVVPYHELHHLLYQHAAKQNAVTFVSIEQLKAINLSDHFVTVNYSDHQGDHELQAKLLIGADGANSTVRTLCDIQTQTQDDDEMAVIATLTLANSHQQQAFERFTKEGTLALLPLPKQCYRLVWVMQKRFFELFSNLSDQQKFERVKKHFIHYIPEIHKITWQQQFPLKTIIAHEQVKNRLVLLGNAAHTIYPLAAQGFNLGLRDAAMLAEVLMAASDVGDRSCLQKYLNLRINDQQRIMQLTKGMSYLFGSEMPLVGPMRGFGMLMSDLITPVKKRLAMRLMGMADYQPKLMQGVALSYE